MPRKFLRDEDIDRIAELWQDIGACCCQIFGRPKCLVCRVYEAELATLGADTLEADDDLPAAA